MNPSRFEVVPIGAVRSSRATSYDDKWDGETAQIVLDDRYSADSLTGLESFSHVELVFLLDQIEVGTESTGARHPRNNPKWPKVGIFAQRGARRPNRIGVTRCKLLGVTGTTITIQGLDAIDGTPVLDIKPVMREFESRGPIEQPDWATELMAQYWT